MEVLITFQDGTTIPAADWPAVRDVLVGLDGRERSFVELHRGGPESLWVAGGNDGRYLVIFMQDVETQASLTLVDPSRPDAMLIIMVQGTAADYPARYGVDRSLMLEAARWFVLHGGRAEHLDWRDYQDDTRSRGQPG